MLNRILRAYAGAVDAEIDFAINLFAQEAKTGSNYQRDCYQVLKDLKTLIDRFLNLERSDMIHQNFNLRPDDLSSASSFSNGHTEQANNARGRQYSIDEGGDVYQELMNWMQNDSQLQSSFRI